VVPGGGATAAAESKPAKARAGGKKEKAGTPDSEEPTKLASTEPAGKGGFGGLQFSSGKQPIHIDADSMSLDYQGKSVTFSGHVRAVQAEAQLASNKLVVNCGADFHDVKEMIADGNVRISQDKRYATGDHAVMDQTKHTVTLTGSPVVHDGNDQITGSKITVYLDTGRSVVDGARAVIFPHQTTADSGGATEQ